MYGTQEGPESAWVLAEETAELRALRWLPVSDEQWAPFETFLDRDEAAIVEHLRLPNRGSRQTPPRREINPGTLLFYIRLGSLAAVDMTLIRSRAPTNEELDICPFLHDEVAAKLCSDRTPELEDNEDNPDPQGARPRGPHKLALHALVRGEEALVLDVCCSFDNGMQAFQEARRIKEEKYAPLQLHLLRRFQRVSVDAIVVGCLGTWDPRTIRQPFFDPSLCLTRGPVTLTRTPGSPTTVHHPLPRCRRLPRVASRPSQPRASPPDAPPAARRRSDDPGSRCLSWRSQSLLLLVPPTLRFLPRLSHLSTSVQRELHDTRPPRATPPSRASSR
ncbi:hypothetical protein MTO96_029542 [Rhipicephalus appendiculatus]